MRSRLPYNMGDNPPAGAGSRPYLKITGALALRFLANPPPPEVTSRQAASVPTSGAPEAPAPISTTPSSPVETPAVTPNDSITQPAPESNNPPPAILPDDTHPVTRPEDFLPFFQFPGNSGDVIIAVPATTSRPPSPGQLPPSSATYQQR